MSTLKRSLQSHLHWGLNNLTIFVNDSSVGKMRAGHQVDLSDKIDDVLQLKMGLITSNKVVIEKDVNYLVKISWFLRYHFIINLLYIGVWVNTISMMERTSKGVAFISLTLLILLALETLYFFKGNHIRVMIVSKA